MTTEAAETTAKPTKYYVDFENVHGAGLKGVDVLGENDEVIIIYSQAAETFHIENAIDIMRSKARVNFVEADAGTRNAADFQLIVALYADMDEGYDYAIISGDGGFDAAIKMGERMGKPRVRRLANIAGDEVEADKPKSRRSRRSRSSRDTAKEAPAENVEQAGSEQAEAAAENKQAAADGKQAQSEAPTEAAAETSSHAPAQQEVADSGNDEKAEVKADEQAEHAEQAEQPKSSSSKRRSRRRKRNGGSTEEQSAASEPEQQAAASEPEQQGNAPEPAQRVSTRKETDDAYARAAEAMRLASEQSGKREAAAEDAAKPESPAAEAAENAALAEDSANVEPPADNAASAESPANAEPSAEDARDRAEEVAAIVKALLEENDVQLTDAQIATVASALEGPDGRQGFYRRIIKIERQQNGRALYRQVREHYTALLKAVSE